MVDRPRGYWGGYGKRPFLTIAQVYKIPAVSILAVSDNLITGEMGFMNPGYYMAESMLIQMAIELVKQLEGK